MSSLQHTLNLLNHRQAVSFQKYAQKAINRANQSRPEFGEYLGGTSTVINGVSTAIVKTSSGSTKRVMVFGSNQALAGRKVVIINPKNSSISAIQGLPAGRNRAV